MGSRSFLVEERSSAAPSAVFAVLADGARWSDWAGPLVRRSFWEREGRPPPGGVGAVRRMGRPPILSREEIVAYDPPRHLAYVITSPGPARHYRADVSLSADGGGTRIAWSATFEPVVPGTGPALERLLAAAVEGFARRLAVHAAAGS